MPNQCKLRNMPKKRLPAIVDGAVREKVTKGRAGIRWDSVVEKVWKDVYIGGETKKRRCPPGSLASTRQK